MGGLSYIKSSVSDSQPPYSVVSLYTERRGLYSGKSVKFASLQLFNFPIFMVWVVVPYLQ